MKKEESIENEEPWEVNSWLDEITGSLSSSQKKSIIYEEDKLLKAGQEESEEELANQIIDYFANEGMLDSENKPQLPAEEVPQIDAEDERMVAESFCRMKRLAGIIKE